MGELRANDTTSTPVYHPPLAAPEDKGQDRRSGRQAPPPALRRGDSSAPAEANPLSEVPPSPPAGAAVAGALAVRLEALRPLLQLSTEQAGYTPVYDGLKNRVGADRVDPEAMRELVAQLDSALKEMSTEIASGRLDLKTPQEIWSAALARATGKLSCGLKPGQLATVLPDASGCAEEALQPLRALSSTAGNDPGLLSRTKLFQQLGSWLCDPELSTAELYLNTAEALYRGSEELAPMPAAGTAALMLLAGQSTEDLEVLAAEAAQTLSTLGSELKPSTRAFCTTLIAEAQKPESKLTLAEDSESWRELKAGAAWVGKELLSIGAGIIAGRVARSAGGSLGALACAETGPGVGACALAGQAAGSIAGNALGYTLMNNALNGRPLTDKLGKNLIATLGLAGATGAGAKITGLAAEKLGGPLAATLGTAGAELAVKSLGQLGVAGGLATTAAVLARIEAGSWQDKFWQEYPKEFGTLLFAHGVQQALGTLIPKLKSADDHLSDAHAKLWAKEGEVKLAFEAQLKAKQLGADTAQLDAKIAQLTGEQHELSVRVWTDLKAALSAEDFSRLTQGLPKPPAPISRIATPGALPEAEVQAALQRLKRGELGAPVPAEESFKVRLPESEQLPNAAFGEAMSAELKSLNSAVRSGEVEGLGQVLQRLQRRLPAAMKKTGRSDLSPDGYSEFGKARGSMSDSMTSMKQGRYEAYGAPVRSRVGAQTVTTEASELSLTTTNSKLGVWIHTGAAARPEALAKAAAAYDRALSANSYEALVEATADVHWWLAQAMPFERGSASAADLVAKTLLQLGGKGGAFSIRPGRWRAGVSPDLEALTTPRAEFGRRYSSYFE